MSNIQNTDFYLQVSKDKVAKHTLLHKFGRNSSIGSSFEAIAEGGLFLTPQVSAATSLRVKIGDVNDAAGGDGAREITLLGLDETGKEKKEAIPTNGTSAGTASTTTFMRLYRAYVSESGTYGTVSPLLSSHGADITIENSGGGTDWLTIVDTDFARGQSTVGAYTVPLGFTAHMHEFFINVDSTKSVDIILVSRANILDTAAPFQAFRIDHEFGGLSGYVSVKFKTPAEFSELTDIIFLGKAGTPADVSVDFDMTLVEN